MSRTIFGAALGLGLALAVGCGSKPEPTVPGEKLEPAPTPGPTPPNPGPNAGAPKAEPPVVWEMDPDKHAIPAAPVKGRLAGLDVVPAVELVGNELIFQATGGTPPVARTVKLDLAAPGMPPFGRKWKVSEEAAPGPGVPSVWLEAEGKGAFQFPPGYALTLELGPRQGSKVPGKIYFSAQDEQKSFLAGTFEAAYSRAPTEPPGPDDVPYVAGTVTAIGTKPGAELRIGYAAFTEMIVSFPEMTLPFVVPAGAAPPTKSETSTYVPGDGVGRAFRYEHVKLAPGRYLLTVAVPGGPTTWKWVDVAPGTARAENLAIDPAQAGGVEVSVPAGVTGTVLAAPADAPDKPALGAELFRLLALHVTRQGTEIVGGKAALKNLAPGRYEVRAGDLHGFVEVTAGKTAELTLAPPKK